MNPLPVGSLQAVVRLQNGEIHTIANGAHVAVIDGGFTVRRTGVRSMIGVGNDLWVQTTTEYIRTQNGVPTFIPSSGFELKASRDGGIWSVAPGPMGPTVITFVGGGFVPVPTPMPCMSVSSVPVVALGATGLIGCFDFQSFTTNFYELSPVALPRLIRAIDAGSLNAAGSDNSNIMVWSPPFFSSRLDLDGGLSPSGFPFLNPGFRVASDGQLIAFEGTSNYRYTGQFWQAITPGAPGLKAIDMAGESWASIGFVLRAGTSVPSAGQALTTSQTSGVSTASRLFRRPDGGVAMLHDYRVYSVSASGVVLESVYPSSLPNGRVSSMADGRALLAHVSGVSVLNPDGTTQSFPGATDAISLPDNRIVAVGNVAQPGLIRVFNPGDGGVTSFDGGGRLWESLGTGTSPSTVTLMSSDRLGTFNVQTGALTLRLPPSLDFQNDLCVDGATVYVSAGGQLFSSRDGGWSAVPLPVGLDTIACGFGAVAQSDSVTISALAPTRSATFAATSLEIAPGGLVFASGVGGEVVLVR